MGKRKSSSKPAPKGKKDTLSTTFKCLFCNHDKSVSVTMDKKHTMFGSLRCKDCGQKFQTPINNLSAAVDVYADWVDACEEARLQQPVKERPMRNPDTLTQHGFAGGARMTMVGNEEEDQDAEGEPEDDDDADSLADFRGPSKKQKETRRNDDDDDDDDDREDDAARTKRRRERIRAEKAKRVARQTGMRRGDPDDDDEDESD